MGPGHPGYLLPVFMSGRFLLRHHTAALMFPAWAPPWGHLRMVAWVYSPVLHKCPHAGTPGLDLVAVDQQEAELANTGQA